MVISKDFYMKGEVQEKTITQYIKACTKIIQLRDPPSSLTFCRRLVPGLLFSLLFPFIMNINQFNLVRVNSPPAGT